MTVSRARALVLPVALLALAACATSQGPGAGGMTGTTVDVGVENRSGMDVHVYALHDGHMVPLGLVEASGSETLTLPPILQGTEGRVALIADPLGSTDWYRSEPMDVGPGSELEFTIEGDLDRSMVALAD